MCYNSECHLCPENCAERPQDYQCCSECGNPFEDGDRYFDINGEKLCENCLIDKYRRTMWYEDYTKKDYMTEKYERERHEI